MSSDPSSSDTPPAPQGGGAHEHLEDYGGGHVQARHGTIAPWLIAVYLILLVWGLYYLFAYWGGLGPGLDY